MFSKNSTCPFFIMQTLNGSWTTFFFLLFWSPTRTHNNRQSNSDHYSVTVSNWKQLITLVCCDITVTCDIAGTALSFSFSLSENLVSNCSLLANESTVKLSEQRTKLVWIFIKNSSSTLSSFKGRQCKDIFFAQLGTACANRWAGLNRHR